MQLALSFSIFPINIEARIIWSSSWTTVSFSSIPFLQNTWNSVLKMIRMWWGLMLMEDRANFYTYLLLVTRKRIFIWMIWTLLLSKELNISQLKSIVVMGRWKKYKKSTIPKKILWVREFLSENSIYPNQKHLELIIILEKNQLS